MDYLGISSPVPNYPGQGVFIGHFWNLLGSFWDLLKSFWDRLKSFWDLLGLFVMDYLGISSPIPNYPGQCAFIGHYPESFGIF